MKVIQKDVVNSATIASELKTRSTAILSIKHLVKISRVSGIGAKFQITRKELLAHLRNAKKLYLTIKN